MLKYALERALELSDSEADVTPKWLIPPHEIEFGESETVPSSDACSPVQGMWLNSIVIASEYHDEQSKFAKSVDEWYHLSHPDVVKLFGASHLQTPCVAVFENVLSVNLKDSLALDGNRNMLWQKFFEVACGLKFLHERGVSLKDVRREDVWIGTDGLAKISRLGAGGRSEDSARSSQRVCWQSPECIQGCKPTAASSVFALGMCIIEAVTGAVLYDEDDRDVAFKVVMGYRAERPDGLTALEWVD